MKDSCPAADVLQPSHTVISEIYNLHFTAMAVVRRIGTCDSDSAVPGNLVNEGASLDILIISRTILMRTN